MASRDWGLWMHAKFVSQLCPELFSTASVAYVRLRETTAILQNNGANFSAQCPRDRRRVCELQHQLKRWNRLLAPINIQLRERNAPGELAAIFFRVTGDLSDRGCRLERAVLILHWLLTKHHCVTAIQVDHWGIFTRPAFFSLLCDGLRECSRLKSLKLCAEHPNPSEHGRLLAAVYNLRHLEELACHTLPVPEEFSGDESKNMVALCKMVENNAKLNRLAIERFDGQSAGMRDIAQALARNETIVDLSLDVSSLPATECRHFSQALKESRSLKSLRLVGSLRKRSLSVAEIAVAVEGLTALVNLELSSFNINTDEAWALANSLHCTQSVQQLALLLCAPNFSYILVVPRLADDYSYCGVNWRIQPFLHMMRKVTSLLKLTLHLNAFPMEDQRAFLEALAANDCIQEVYLPTPSYDYMHQLCSLICETATASRVRMGTIRGDDQHLVRTLKGRYVRDVSMPTGERSPDEMYRWFAELPSLHALATLSVDVASAIDAKSAELFSQYLRNTQQLKEITMSFYACHDEALVLLDGLSYNTSITTVVVEHWCQSRHTARILADIVNSSKTIRAITYHSASKNPSPAFFSALAKRIESNYTISSVQAFRLISAVKEWNLIQEVVARNSTVLAQAAKYATGSTVENRGAAALELLRSDPMLVSKVREMAPVDEKEAKGMIKTRLADLDDLDTFMRVAGVVKETVVCNESAKACTSLETINYDCWLLLRRYLRVTDVVGVERW